MGLELGGLDYKGGILDVWGFKSMVKNHIIIKIIFYKSKWYVSDIIKFKIARKLEKMSLKDV